MIDLTLRRPGAPPSLASSCPTTSFGCPILRAFCEGWDSTNLDQVLFGRRSQLMHNRHKRPISSHSEVCEILRAARPIRLDLHQPDTPRKDENASLICASATHDGFQVAEGRHEANSCPYAAL
jgi:hypothetical protein